MSEENLIRTCNRCKRTLSISNFYRDRWRNENFDYWCKDCRKQAAKDRYDARVIRDRRLKYPQKTKARQLVNNNIRSGKMVRGSCFLCGEPKTDGHHLDYDYPDKVIWLCRKHHSEVHSA